ncbi:MAG: hypothetical protein K0S74_1150 [Chlamydiales bacterium]|jgi:DNA-directed RNA polymerase subunit F|nr:hypothetical protein [Chlamydiales bacterium]
MSNPISIQIEQPLSTVDTFLQMNNLEISSVTSSEGKLEGNGSQAKSFRVSKQNTGTKGQNESMIKAQNQFDSTFAGFAALNCMPNHLKEVADHSMLNLERSSQSNLKVNEEYQVKAEQGHKGLVSLVSKIENTQLDFSPFVPPTDTSNPLDLNSLLSSFQSSNQSYQEEAREEDRSQAQIERIIKTPLAAIEPEYSAFELQNFVSLFSKPSSDLSNRTSSQPAKEEIRNLNEVQKKIIQTPLAAIEPEYSTFELSSLLSAVKSTINSSDESYNQSKKIKEEKSQISLKQTIQTSLIATEFIMSESGYYMPPEMSLSLSITKSLSGPEDEWSSAKQAANFLSELSNKENMTKASVVAPVIQLPAIFSDAVADIGCNLHPRMKVGCDILGKIWIDLNKQSEIFIPTIIKDGWRKMEHFQKEMVDELIYLNKFKGINEKESREFVNNLTVIGAVYLSGIKLDKLKPPRPNLVQKFTSTSPYKGGHIQYTDALEWGKLKQRSAKVNPKTNRIDYKKGYAEAVKNFLGTPKEFNGTLSKDLLVANFHSDELLGKGRTLAWGMPIQQINKLATIEEVLNSAALLKQWGERSNVTLIRIPAGEKVRFLYGKALIQTDVNEVRPGGAVQYRFYDIDPKWIKEQRLLNVKPSKEINPIFKQ